MSSDEAPPSPGSPGSRRSLALIARSGSLNLLGTAAGAGLTLGLTAALARGTSPEVAGAVFSITSLFLVLAALAELGSDVSLARFLPRALNKGSSDDARVIIRTALLLAMLLGTGLTLAMVLLRQPVAAVLSGPQQQEQVAIALVLLAVTIPFAACMNTLLAAARGLGSFRPTVLVDKLGRAGLQLGLVVLVVAAGGGLVALVAAWSVPYLLAAAQSLTMLRVRIRALPSSPHQATALRPLLREYAVFTWPRAVSRLCQILMQRADIVLVAILRTPAEAAVYTVATRFLVLGQLAVQSVQQVLAPQTSRLLAAGAQDDAAEVFRVTTTWTMALTWPFYLWTMTAAPLLLSLLGGPSYLSGETVVVLLSAAALVVAAGGPVDTMLLMAGRSGLSLVNNLVGLLLLLALDLLLIPTLGINGAALAWATTMVVRNLLGVAQIRRLLGIYPYSTASVRVIISAALTMGVPSLLLRTAGFDGPVIVLAAVVGLPVYLGVLWRSRSALGAQGLGLRSLRSDRRGGSCAPS